MDLMGKAHIIRVSESSAFHDRQALTCKDDATHLFLGKGKKITFQGDRPTVKYEASIYERIILLGAFELETAVAGRGTIWSIGAVS